MRDGLLRNQPMVLDRPKTTPAPRHKAGPDVSNHMCACGRWGAHTFDAGQTWWCSACKREER